MNALGGCCGSRPEHIAAIVDMASSWVSAHLHGCRLGRISLQHVRIFFCSAATCKAALCRFPARPKHGIDPLMRLSGLEPMEYTPNTENMRSTFLYIGERCNVAGSSIYKKVGAGVLLLMSASVFLAAVACRYADMAHMPHARVNADCRPS